jgi:6-phosphogluconate dehydrogenase
MRLGIIGLGRMGMNMARRLLKDKHEVVAFNRSREKVGEFEKEGGEGAVTLEEFIGKLPFPRVVWLMLPAGEVTEEHIGRLEKLLSKGDILIEGGNSYYKDDIRRAGELGKSGIIYMDAGVSGGIWGLKNGYSTMVGGSREGFETIEPIIKSLAPDEGYLYCGGTGAGHFVKMLHNGIEYALMEAYGEGFQILKASGYGPGLKLKDVAHIWNRGSVVRSWLLELLEDAFEKDPELSGIEGYVGDSGEARWTVKEAVDEGVAADVITASLFKRFNSRQKDVFANRIMAALRNEFGGHSVLKAGQDFGESGSGAGEVRHSPPDAKK